MDEQAVRNRAQGVCEALVAGDIDRASEDFSKELRQNLGEVRDAFGMILEQPIAPLDGVVIFLVTSLAMNEGDPLLALAG